MSESKLQTLGGLCELAITQINPATAPNALYVGLEHLTPGRLVRSGGGLGSEVQSQKFAFRKGDVLYGKLRPYLDKAILADADGVCTTELLVLRPKVGVDPRFVACVVHESDFIDYAMAGVTGAHHPRTSWSHIAQFPLLDFDEIERSKIATLLWRIHDLLKVNESGLESAGKLKRATMRQLFTRGLRGEVQKETEFGPVPESWDIRALDDVAAVQTGLAKGRRVPPAEMLTVPYLRVANVQDGHLDLREMKSIEIRRTELQRFLLQDGDVVLTEGGDFDKLGRGFIWHGQIQNCVHQNHVFAVRVNRAELVPEFMAYLVQCPYGRAYFLKVAHKTTNLASINTTKLKAFPVLVPELAEQHEIVAILDALDRKIALHQEKHQILAQLFKLLLHKFMTGEIRITDIDLSVLGQSTEPSLV